MPGTTRAIVQVCVGISATLCSLSAAGQATQTAPLPPASTAASGQETSSPAPPRPAPALTPEQRAFQDANRIQDPVQKLDALRKVQADLKGSAAAFTVRQVDEAILWHLVAQFRDRRDDIASAFNQVSDGQAKSPEAQLLLLPTITSRLLDNQIILGEAETELARLVASVKPSTDALRTARGRAFEALGRIHVEQGHADKASEELKTALETNPSLTRAPILLAEIEAKRGNNGVALDYYLLATVSGRMKSAEEAAMRALYRRVRGSDGDLEAELDRVYDKHFSNPISPKKYQPATGSRRVAVLELFTGSACAPCVSADLSWDAVLVRYPENVIAPLAYHAHIPGPDPMVVPGGDARRLYYEVRGVPTFNVNGALARVGGGSRDGASRTYDAYVTAIDKALARAPAAEVQIHAERSGSKVNVVAKASGLPAGASDLRLHVVLAERHLAFSGENGIRHHAMVVRSVAGDKGSGIPIRGASDTTVDHSFDLDLIRSEVENSVADEIARRVKTRAASATPPDYRADGRAMGTINPDALVVVAFVQDASKNVLQAARADVK